MSTRHGAVVSRDGCMQCDGIAQDGGVVWRRGGIDGRPGMVNAMISLEDGVEEDGGSNFYDVCVSCDAPTPTPSADVRRSATVLAVGSVVAARESRIVLGVSYEINGNAYDKPYYLADGIYPDWATLVKIVRNPNSEKTRMFAKMQEACRKDVERGFGVLQTRWAIVHHPTRIWSLKTMHEVINCCVIMYNMIVENERDDGQ
ncbi:hypothetical protein QYE76_035130 [Lolium multiflorum]|uniref:DDE Tnp4 domain-containing protein n=1 Tax=Lolium multiflorum TaxID=4521 RepID=A0AAD8R0C0_LOLMU|nr:hypothetical protein QYE76_035130 [Lolium multiflorum]